MERSINPSTNFDFNYVHSQPVSVNRVNAMREFPIKSNPFAFSSFPFTTEKCKRSTSIATMPNELEDIKHKRHQLSQFTKMPKDLCDQENIELIKSLDNHVGALFPVTNLITTNKNEFPITDSKCKVELEKHLDLETQLLKNNHNSIEKVRFLLIHSTDSLKFPLKYDFIEANLIKRFNIRAAYRYKSSSKPMLGAQLLSGNDEPLVHFPVTKITMKRQNLKEKSCEKLFFPIKTDLFANIPSTTTIKCNNNYKYNCTSSSSTMTPPQNLADENMYGRTLVNTNNEIKKNLESYEREKLKQQQEQEQDHPMETFLHNDNDDKLAIGEAKNTFYSGQQKKCDEPRQITETQNSRSSSAAWYSGKNMNDLQKHNQQQQIKVSSDIQPTTKTALTITGMRNGMQRDDQIVDFAPNTNINMSIRNSLSDTYFKNQQDLQLKQLAHSEVRDPSSQEVQIIYRCFACEKSIIVASVHPPAKQSSYVNESTTSTSLTPTPSTALTTAESPPVQNDCQCLVNKNRCSILDAGDCDVNCISTETDDEGNERSTDSGHASIANKFLKGSDNAMTIQKVVEVNEEGNISASSSELDDNQYSIGGKRSLSGMKVDMNSSKLAPGVTTPTISSNPREKSEPKKVMSVKGNNVLAAATDISKLANFGKTRRESSLMLQSGSAASVDEKDSVLPTRTLIRRQKRLQLQGSEDKQEDPTERLNRLRARISGALTEVKGVLKHYSVDESAETNQTPPLTNSATVGDRMTATEQKPALSQSDLKGEGSVSFRFVKKVRRRSVFSDDDANKIRKECSVENTGVEPTTKDEVNTSDKNKKKGAEEVRESLKEHGNEPTEVAYHISEGDVANNIKKPLNATSKENEISNGQNNIAIPAISLGTVDETKTGDELNLQSRLQRIEPEITENWPKEEYIKRTENVVKKEYKDKNVEIGEDKQNIEPQPINTKKSSRRASVALVEGSQIDPPVNKLIPLKIKTQRRPSDSETLIKQKIKHTETGSNTSIKKAKTVGKVKRPSVKSNNVVITKNKSASNAEINQSNKNIKDAITSALEVSSAITSVDAVTTKKKITETVPKTSETFSTRLAITIAINDASSLSSAEKPNDKSTKATQPLSPATNNSRTPTKLADQNGASVAPLVRPLRTGESNSHKNKTQTQPLPPPTSNTKIDTPFAISPKDQCTNEEYLNVSTPTQINENTLNPQSVTATDGTATQNLDLENLSKKDKDTAELTILPSVSGFNIIDTIKKDPRISGTENNLAQPLTQEEPHKLPTELCTDIMPEQQVAPTPVKSVQVFAEKDLNKTTFPTKKIIVKRIVRKNSVDKAIEKNKANNSSSITVADETEKHERLISDSQSLIDLVIEKSESTEEESALCDKVIRPEEPSPEVPVESTKSKKSRKVKKKVIIKRQHRKLSVGETTFFKETEQPDDSSADTETLERAIAYVTDEEDEASDRDVELMKPIKSCIKQREFQVGDWVMYGERFRKTQIRWRKGQITERITSISYKINIDGTEFSAHISYIKKYTDRKVNFGGKEYLEIDYEQIAEEERRARTYSIWNMV